MLKTGAERIGKYSSKADPEFTLPAPRDAVARNADDDEVLHFRVQIHSCK